MFFLNKLYYFFSLFLNKDRHIKTLILLTQYTILVFVIYFVRKKMGLENIFFGEKFEITRTMFTCVSILILGIFNHFYFSPERVGKIKGKRDRNA